MSESEQSLTKKKINSDKNIMSISQSISQTILLIFISIPIKNFENRTSSIEFEYYLYLD